MRHFILDQIYKTSFSRFLTSHLFSFTPFFRTSPFRSLFLIPFQLIFFIIFLSLPDFQYFADFFLNSTKKTNFSFHLHPFFFSPSVFVFSFHRASSLFLSFSYHLLFTLHTVFPTSSLRSRITLASFVGFATRKRN